MAAARGSRPPYRAAVIGCGAIGSTIEDDVRDSGIRIGLPYGHAPVYRASARTVLVAGADPDPERRRAFARRWGLPPERVYADAGELFARERPDVVSVATPTPLHAEIALAAVAAGVRAIFLEKPIATNLADAERVVRACRAAGVALAVNHTRRGDPVYRKARELIASGAIGQLHSLVAHFNGHLMWTGTHAFDLLNYFNGDRPAAWLVGHLDDALARPADGAGSGAEGHPRPPPGRPGDPAEGHPRPPPGRPGDPAEQPFDPGGSAYVVYENGVRAFVNAATGGAIRFRVHAIGTAGEIVIGNYDLELWRSNPESRRHELLRHPFPQTLPAVAPMAQLLDELLDAVEGGPDPLASGETAIAALRLIVALHQSSRAGSRPVRVAEADPHLTIPAW